MAIARKRTATLMAAIAMLALACGLALGAPLQAQAKTVKDTATYSFTSLNGAGGDASRCAYQIKVAKKTMTFKGTGYRMKGSSFKALPSKTYKFAYDKSTKFLRVTNSELGTTEKVAKAQAVSDLREGRFIAVRLKVRKGVVKTVTFGV